MRHRRCTRGSTVIEPLHAGSRSALPTPSRLLARLPLSCSRCGWSCPGVLLTLHRSARRRRSHREDPTRRRRRLIPTILGQAERMVGKVYFPDWSARFGWHAVGERVDHLDGRLTVTVYYAWQGRRIAYTIVPAPALARPRAAVRRLEGTELRTLAIHERLVLSPGASPDTPACLAIRAAAQLQPHLRPGWRPVPTAPPTGSSLALELFGARGRKRPNHPLTPSSAGRPAPRGARHAPPRTDSRHVIAVADSWMLLARGLSA